jgi:hypothetical protein
LAGGEGIQGIYGSISSSGMQKIFDSMNEHCGFDNASRLLDIGSGLGRPLVHAIITQGIDGAFGIEIDRVKCMKATTFLHQTAKMLESKGVIDSTIRERLVGITISGQNIADVSVKDLDSSFGSTHAFSFWEGFSDNDRTSMGRLFSESQKLRCIVVVQRKVPDPDGWMQKYGFTSLTLCASIKVSMSGSGQCFTAYVFSRT